MGQTDSITLRENAGWEPSMKLVYHRIDEGLVLHQLWTHVSGRSEYRPVPIDEKPPFDG